MVMKLECFTAICSGWIRRQSSLSWVVPSRGMGETLKLPLHFLHSRSNVCHPRQYKSQQIDGLLTLGSSLLWLCELWAVFPQVL